MATLLKSYVDRRVLLAFCTVGIIVTSLVTLARLYVRLRKQRKLREDDYALFIGVACYITLSSLYIADLPYLYGFMDVVSGKAPVGPDLVLDYRNMMKYNFAVTPLFWVVLWFVKVSLLLFFRRIIFHSRVWMTVWWAIMAFTIATFIGCILSQWASCDWSVETFLVLGRCTSPRLLKAQIFSLYYSFAADVITDILIMALPLRIVWFLHMPRQDKCILIGLFGVTIIEIATASIRVFFIWARTGNSTPSPPWLALWAVIQNMVAIIVGCIPVLSQVFRTAGDTTSSHRQSHPLQQRLVNSGGTYPTLSNGKFTTDGAHSPDPWRNIHKLPLTPTDIRRMTGFSLSLDPLLEIEQSLSLTSCTTTSKGRGTAKQVPSSALVSGKA